MGERKLTRMRVKRFGKYLQDEERAPKTIEKYLHDLEMFQLWLGERGITKEIVVQWKNHLMQNGRSAVTVNGALAALHSFFAMMGWNDCRVRYLKVQRQMFRDESRELTRAEFLRLIAAAQVQGNRRLSLLMEAICGTGIRVSEVRYLTVEAVRKGRADIALKGKIRTILIPGKLAKKLHGFAKQQKIAHGEIFITVGGKGLSRKQIWWEMKQLSKAAGVDATKIFPHNLRHLVARRFYQICKDIVSLADVLGHSSVETTRIYLISTGAEHAKQLEKMRLVS